MKLTLTDDGKSLKLKETTTMTKAELINVLAEVEDEIRDALVGEYLDFDVWAQIDRQLDILHAIIDQLSSTNFQANDKLE